MAIKDLNTLAPSEYVTLLGYDAAYCNKVSFEQLLP